jgi:hypothetical protein
MATSSSIRSTFDIDLLPLVFTRSPPGEDV